MEILTVEQENGETIGQETISPLNIQAASFLYIRGRYAQERATLFQSDNSLSRFIWKSETNTPAGRTGAEINLNSDGILTVTKFNAQTEEKNYQLSGAAIPTVFLEQLYRQLLDSDRKKIVVDTIEPNGTITATLLQKIEAKDTAAKEAAYVLKMDFLDGRGFSELIYLDSQKQIFKSLLRQKDTFTVERTGRKNILAQFPEKAGYILQKNEFLEQNQTEY